MSTTRTIVKRRAIRMKLFRLLKQFVKPIYVLKALRILINIISPKRK